jgi:hypothetical protein
MPHKTFLAVLLVVALLLYVSISLKPRAVRMRESRGLTGTTANGYTVEVSNLMVNNELFHFLFYVSNTGALTQEVAVDFGPQGMDLLPPDCPTHKNYDNSYHILRELGPSARVFDAWAYGPVSGSAISQYINPITVSGAPPIQSVTNNSCKAMMFGGPTSQCSTQGGGFVDSPTDPNYSASAVTKYVCYVNDLESKNLLIKMSTHLRTMTVLATTSEHDDLRVWNLIVTYKGLGLLSQVRGSNITLESFLSGYTSLFDDVDTPDCGQRTWNGNHFNSANALYAKTCGQSCSVVAPYKERGPVIWEMASKNGRYRLQFYDSGNVSFLDTNSIVPIYSTIANMYPNEYTVDYPLCTINQPNPNAPGVGLEKQRDAWIIRGATFSAVLSDLNNFNASNVDLMVQITNYGVLVIQKDYKYGSLITDGSTQGSVGLFKPVSGGEPGNTSHVVVQSVVPRTSLAQNATLGNYTVSSSTDVKTDNVVSTSASSGPGIGFPSINDTQNYQQHFSLGNVLVCQGWNAMAEYDWNNGTTLAVSNTFNGKQYYLWIGPFGLRLLHLTDLPQPDDLSDWTQSLWITDPYTEWFYHHDVTTPNPQRLTRIQALQDCLNGAKVLRCSLATCGTFTKPVAYSNDSVLLTLRSPNKRYCFYMLSSGVCRLVDGTTVLYSTDDYIYSTTCATSTNSC